jgi:hypothetical protein
LHFEKAKDCTRVSVHALNILQAKQRIALQSFVEYCQVIVEVLVE